MKKQKRIILSLTIILVLMLSLCGCNTKEYTPGIQGTKVMTIDYRDISGYETNTFNSFGEFNGSEYAGMCLDGNEIPARNSFYTRSFFLNHNLMVAKFNDENNIQHFVNSIKKEGNIYTVSILRFRDTLVSRPSQKSFALFLEIPSYKKLKDAVLKVNLEPVTDLPDIVSGNSLISTSDEPCIVDEILSFPEFASYQSKVDSITKDRLSVFDAQFFLLNKLITVDFIGYDNTITCYDYNENNRLLNLNAYNSDHYTAKRRKSKRIVKYIPMPKATIVDKVMYNNYWESDIDSPNIDSFVEINITKEYAE